MRKKVVYFSTSGEGEGHASGSKCQARCEDARAQLTPAEYDAVLKTLQHQMRDLISNNKLLSRQLSDYRAEN